MRLPVTPTDDVRLISALPWVVFTSKTGTRPFTLLNSRFSVRVRVRFQGSTANFEPNMNTN